MIFVPGHISQYSSKLYFFTFLFCFEIILKLQKKIIVTLHKNSHVAFPNFWVDAFIFFFLHAARDTVSSELFGSKLHTVLDVPCSLVLRIQVIVSRTRILLA